MNELLITLGDILSADSQELSQLAEVFSPDFLYRALALFFQIIVLTGIIFILRKLLTTIVDKLMSNRLANEINERTGRDNNRISTLQRPFKSIINYVLYFILAMGVLDMLGVNITAILAGAGIASLAVAFGAQKIVQDLISGLFIILENQYSVGEYIKIGDIVGKVEEIGMKTTKIASYNGEVVSVPNGNMQTIINYSRYPQRRNVDVGVAYEEDTDHAIQAIELACQKVNNGDLAIHLAEKCHTLGVFELADSSVVIHTTFTAYDWKQASIEMALRQTIKDTLVSENVEISYPKLQLMQ